MMKKNPNLNLPNNKSSRRNSKNRSKKNKPSQRKPKSTNSPIWDFPRSNPSKLCLLLLMISKLLSSFLSTVSPLSHLRINNQAKSTVCCMIPIYPPSDSKSEIILLHLKQSYKPCQSIHLNFTTWSKKTQIKLKTLSSEVLKGKKATKKKLKKLQWTWVEPISKPSTGYFFFYFSWCL